MLISEKDFHVSDTCWPWKGPVCMKCVSNAASLGTSVLSYSFCSLTDCVLGQFSRQKKPHCSLYLTWSDRRSFVVVRQSWGFSGNPFKHVVHKAVHNAHGFTGNSSIRMYLLQYFVNVNGVTFLPPLPLFFIGFTDVLLSFARLLDRLSTSLWWHCEATNETFSVRIDASRT